MKKCVCGNEMFPRDWSHEWVCKRCGRKRPMAAPMTNVDHIRSMTDEELAVLLLSRLNIDTQQIPFCKGSAECDDLCDTRAGVPIEKCQACMLRWLHEPWQGW